MPEHPDRHGEDAVISTQPTENRPAHWFKPGNNANPYGNTAPLRSFAAHIRQETGFGREIAAFYLAIMRGEPIKMPEKLIRRGRNGRKLIATAYIRPTLDQRIDAAAWLADRGWGKAKETIELTGEASPAQRLELLRRLSEPERDQLRALLQRALEPPTVLENQTPLQSEQDETTANPKTTEAREAPTDPS